MGLPLSAVSPSVARDNLAEFVRLAASAVWWISQGRLFGQSVALQVGRQLSRMEIVARRLAGEERERARELVRALEGAALERLGLSAGICS